MYSVVAIFISIFLFISNHVCCQDKIILVNGEHLSGKVIKQSTRNLTISEEGIERELNSELVSKVILASGKEIEFTTSFTLEMAYDATFAVLEFSEGLEDDIGRTFKYATRREFKVDIDNSRGDISSKLLTSATRNPSLNKKQSEAIGYLRFLGYSCNPFLTLVSVEEDVCKYVFYSNPVTPERIKNYLFNRSVKLVDSKASNTLRNIIDHSVKTFTMTFLTEGRCSFIEQGSEEKIISYEINDNGSITFWDQGKKKEKGMTYEIVALEDTFMRYTLFEPGNKTLITRKVQVIDRQ